MISITPYITPEKLGDYQDRLLELIQADAALNQIIPESIRHSTEWLLRQVNCFYSNKIEGNPTHPKDLLNAQEATGPKAGGRSQAIMELLAHLEVQIKLKKNSVNLSEVCTQDFIKDIHKSFYKNLPEEFMRVKDLDGRDVLDDNAQPLLIVPGEYRDHGVRVGRHIPPDPQELNGYMAWLEKQFDPSKIFATNRVIAAAALHHRLAWIHPFQDGNGRVIRLLTDCYMRCAGFGGYGLWSITRGFGRDTASYYAALARADMPRQGMSDGRGILSDEGLLHFTKYFIDTALDQVKFFSGLFEPRKLCIRIDYYFEMRAKGGLPDVSGEPLPLLKIVARDIYRLLLDRGALSRADICKHLGKGEQTLRPIFKQMLAEGLIATKRNKKFELQLSKTAIEFIFPQLW
ncbi:MULTISPECIES: Fic family protein [unclassified Pseudomonas]|uniref:Fic family protein n=1 Tax=unclassified Pseudomonas TaxID=196821 RepID=UPI0015A19262|nr:MULTISPECIES: Fic family protein [unclassified Pseudomonas]NVZ13706.1 Fic family protein [Pseudomonas sp. IPO3775]NWA77685.1 Fic family protein [Pseudomonas sp. C8002]